MPYPTLASDILLLPADDGYIAYDRATDRLHRLNPAAALIAELCDGSRLEDELRTMLAPLFPDEGAVERWLTQAKDSGLIALCDAPSERAPEPSAQELAALARELADGGRLQVAFHCWQRVVEMTPDDAMAWHALGDAAYWLFRREDARAAYARYLQFHPDDAKLAHVLTALEDRTPPARASDACIQQLYSRLAHGYDTLLRVGLDYQAPERLRDAIVAVTGERRDLTVLDLGCGSGLMGACLKPLARAMTGIDLSPEMIALARERNMYDRLDVAEIGAWLAGHDERFDLIAACECLVYFGDLGAISAAVAHRLNPGGVFALTVERGERHPFQLTDSGRYAHTAEHLRAVADAAGLRVASLQDGFLRMEYGAPVVGLYATFEKTA